MVTGVAAVAIVPEPKVFDKGLVFVKDTDVLLSGDKWTIVVNIALDDYSNLVELMKAMIKQVRQEVQMNKNTKSYSFDVHWEEVSRLDKLIGELDIDLRSFQKLLFEETVVGPSNAPKVRFKRGLIDVLGYGMKYLFGTADARDVQRLTKVCNELHTFQSKMVHATEQQLTCIRTLDEVNKQNMKGTVEMARALLDSIRNLSLKLTELKLPCWIHKRQ
jgi:hypothetical protein